MSAFYISVLGMVLFLHTGSRPLEMVIAKSASLNTEWLEFHPKSAMKAVGDWSEVLVEIPGLDSKSLSDRLLLQNGDQLSIAGYLRTESGEKVALDHIELVGIGGKILLRLSNKQLQWRRNAYQFRSIVLRANRAVTIGRIIWISYDPRSTHTGFFIPDCLK